MMALIQSHSDTIMALGALGALMFCQLLVADVVGLRAKHTPGDTVTTDHELLLFRAVRTVANTNESIAIFLVALAFCVLSGASAQTTAYAAWTFVVARALYALCYYLNIQTLRSIMFGLSLLGTAALLITGLMAIA